MKISQSIAPAAGNAMQNRGSFSTLIGTPNYQRMLETAIADPKKRSTFVSSLISAVATVPKLKDCTPDSIISAALPFVAFDFQFGVGCAYVVPYGDKATFIMGAKGYRQLAMRSGQYRKLDTIEVRQGEFLGRNEETGEPEFRFIRDDDERENLPIVGYLAYFELLTGFKASVYWSKERVMKHAKRYSQSFDPNLYRKYQVYLETGEGITKDELRYCSSPWISSFDQMAAKTVLKNLLSTKGVLSVDLVKAFDAENDRGSIENAAMFNAPEAVPEAAVKPTEEVGDTNPHTTADTNPSDEKFVSADEDGVVIAEEPKKRGRKPKADAGANTDAMDALFFNGEEA